jgi:hypothetical protein
MVAPVLPPNLVSTLYTKYRKYARNVASTIHTRSLNCTELAEQYNFCPYSNKIDLLFCITD